ncbi:MAG: hypothetical protein ABSD74_18820 [Rhizomicrobium sp.]|jgi:hypothetical protein
MTTVQTRDDAAALSADKLALAGSHGRTLETIFHHPSAHNLAWRDVVGLMEKVGRVDEKPDGEFAFEVSGKCHVMHRYHSKDLAQTEVLALRKFLMQALWAADPLSEASNRADPAAPNLMVVVDHHEAKIFQVDVTSGDSSKHVIRPYDPHHFLHHLVHKDQSREEGQRAPEDHGFYEKIADAVSLGGKIVVVGHGTGKSNAAHHLAEYLRTHHSETWRHVVKETVADLSSVTDPQFLDMAREAFRE